MIHADPLYNSPMTEQGIDYCEHCGERQRFVIDYAGRHLLHERVADVRE